MTRSSLVLAVSLLGCASAPAAPSARAPEAEEAPSGAVGPTVTAPETAAYEVARTGRPRLSRTVTLGQDESAYAGVRAPGQAAAPVGGTTLIVNQNVVVQQPPVVFGGYGFGYGYGYGGQGYGRGYGSGEPGGARSRAGGTPTGWEGAQRTAAPGQTPGVGGNWAPVQDVGPKPMR